MTDRTAHDDDAAFIALRAHFDDREIVELTLICAMWNLSNRFAEALCLVVEPPGQRITFQPTDLGPADGGTAEPHPGAGPVPGSGPGSGPDAPAEEGPAGASP